MFDNYICKTTGLPCCGCSFYCEHRSEPKVTNQTLVKEKKYEILRGNHSD